MRLNCKIALLLAFILASIGICAQETNRLSIQGKKMQRGSEITLPVNMDNVDDIVAVQFTLTVPSGFTVNPVSATLSSRKRDHSITARSMGNNKYKFVIVSPTNSVIEGFKGKLFSFNVKALSSLEEDKDYSFQISDAVMSVKSGENVIKSTDGGIVTIATLPNIHVASVDCSEPVAGRNMSVTWTVRNDGKGNTGDTQWVDYVWMVTDVNGGTARNSILLATSNNVSALASGESYTNTVNVKLQERIYGNYHIVVTSDMRTIVSIDDNGYATTDEKYNLIDEENETETLSDNFAYTPIEIIVPPLPDIVVSNIRVTSADAQNENQPSLASVYSGTKVKVLATVKNQGDATVDVKRIKNEVYLSSSEVYDQSKSTLMNSVSLPLVEMELVKTADIANHNAKSLNSETPVVVNPSYAIKEYRAVIAPGATENIEFLVTIPKRWVGDAYFHVNADTEDAVYELANKKNNWGCSPRLEVLLSPVPDLKPTTIEVPVAASSKSRITVDYTVSNIGAGKTDVRYWNDNIYITQSPDGLDETAILIGSFRHGEVTPKIGNVVNQVVTGSANKAGGVGIIQDTPSYTNDDGNYRAQCDMILPLLSSGTYYIYVKVDAGNNVFEYQAKENNIIRSKAIEVQNADLSVTFVSLSEENLITNDEVAVTWKVKNTGAVDLQNVTLNDAIYASAYTSGLQPVLLSSVSNSVSIAKGAEKTLRANITIPKNSNLNGKCYVFVKTNHTGIIAEENTDNNTSEMILKDFEYIPSVEELEKLKVNGTNITLYNINAPAEVVPGENFSINYNLKNSGTEAVTSVLKQELYISDSKVFDKTNAVLLLSKDTKGSYSKLESGSDVNVGMEAIIPATLKGGRKYLHLRINDSHTMLEKTYSDNSVATQVLVNGNVPQIELVNIQIPTTINTEEPTEISLTLSNKGTWDADYLACDVYLSSDNTIDKEDVKLDAFTISKLAVGKSHTHKHSIKIEDGTASDMFIIIKPSLLDESISTFSGIDASVKAINVHQSPVADLSIYNLSVNEECTAGETISIEATVKNTGVVATRKDKWADAFYLSPSYTFDKKTALYIGSKTHVGVVDMNESYQISATARIPSEANGYYVLFVIADANSSLYELNRSDNVDKVSILVSNTSATPTDLSIGSVSAPANIEAGTPVAISYKVSNIGENNAKGLLRDVIYMSKDDKFDVTDEMVGVVTGNIDLAPGNSIERTAIGQINSVTEGDYYIIVKTNSTHNIAEIDYDNNISVQQNTSSLDFATMSIGETSSGDTYALYKIHVSEGDAGKTLGLSLQHQKDTPSSIYISYEKVPSSAIYDRHSGALETTSQEVLVPNIKPGTYYVLAQANSATRQNLNEFFIDDYAISKNAPFSIASREVSFGPTSLNLKEGGTDGWITTEIKGALMDSIMDFRLATEKDMIPAEHVVFRDQTASSVTFNLRNAEVGTYDIVAELPNGTQATLPDGFRVIPGVQCDLGIKIDAPRVVHSGSNSPVSIAFANGGTNDIQIKEILVVMRGAYLGNTVSDLKMANSELHLVPEGYEADRFGYITIAPGTQRVVNFFMEQRSSTSYMTVYVVK